MLLLRSSRPSLLVQSHLANSDDFAILYPDVGLYDSSIVEN